ncbi:hypothetical protein SAMN06295912_11948 [Sphingomonas laterariae]|uniref:Uncharacterized protein n=1 Tax=Edaphosphingomonas laterariae TaxID=861865 RepID=A0A239HV55_9SPHN|nr:hypothetical protein [Sphingomonas laterariae]SNS85175.1 hypothetical protein SAMN06295912_11948 [Sphingomonas laterariae]
MDTVPTIEAEAELSAAEPQMDAPPAIGSDERRMHVRAYNYWVSLLAGRPFPAIQDLDPAGIADFGPNSVLLDFSRDPENPAIAVMGADLRDEGDYADVPPTIAEVPGGSLLSRLTDHYLEIIANRAPIGFEAEFVNQRGANTLYRGILMPFSSGGETIDFVYGVISWKEVVSAAEADALSLEIGQALAAPSPAPIWADGPNAAAPFPIAEEDFDADWFDAVHEQGGYDATAEIGLADRLALARETADAARTARARTRAALYRALGLAYDFALVAEARPDEYAELLADCGMKAQARAPMTPVVKLVFGADYDKTRLTEFAAALAYARRTDVGLGELRGLLESHEGGLKGLVAAERAARRPAHRPAPADPRTALRAAPPRAHVDLGPVADEFLLLVGRREPNGSVAILAPVTGEEKLLEQALRRSIR